MQYVSFFKPPTALTARKILGRFVHTTNEGAPGMTWYPAEPIHYEAFKKIGLESAHVWILPIDLAPFEFLIELKRKNYRSALRRKMRGDKNRILRENCILNLEFLMSSKFGVS